MPSAWRDGRQTTFENEGVKVNLMSTKFFVLGSAWYRAMTKVTNTTGWAFFSRAHCCSNRTVQGNDASVYQSCSTETHLPTWKHYPNPFIWQCLLRMSIHERNKVLQSFVGCAADCDRIQEQYSCPCCCLAEHQNQLFDSIHTWGKSIHTVIEVNLK